MITQGPARDGKSGKLVTLQLIVQEVSCASDLREATRIIVRRVRKAMQTDVCSVYLSEPGTRTLVLSATEGLNPDTEGACLNFDEGLVGLAAESAEPVNLRDASRHPRYKPIPHCGEEAFHGFLGVPIMYHAETLGVIVVQQIRERRYRDTDVAFLVTLGVQLAGAILLARAGDAPVSVASKSRLQENYVDAIAGSPGVAIGVGVTGYIQATLESIPDRVPEDPHAEVTAFRNAVSAVVEALQRLQTDLGESLQSEDRALFEALSMIASSDMLVDATIARIHAGNWAPGALRETIDNYAKQFSGIEDPYLRERERDIRDLGQRILARLQQIAEIRPDYPERTILVGDDLSPIDLAGVPREHLVGVVSAHGSSMSHLAIFASARGIPAILGTADKILSSQLDSKELIIDGYSGRLYINPGLALLSEYRRLEKEEQALSAELAQLKELPAETPDGFLMALYANAGIFADIIQSQAVGAEGIGLYRTELPFMLRDRFPGEEEQRQFYRQVLETFSARPVTLRTLDIGGDKSLPYFPIKEPNPALGWRGIRFALDTPVIFITQLRAMIRASIGLENLRILIPMVSSADEAEEALALVRRAWQELTNEGVTVSQPPCGFMIEVPAAVCQADAFARYADFLSIGTNDLTQYLLAVDRGNAHVASRFEPLHPAVIRALQYVLEVAKEHDKPVSICGQAAGDPAMVLLLMGMGYSDLSMSASDLPRIKYLVRNFPRVQAQSLLDVASKMEKAVEIRRLLTRALIDAGLGGLVYAGK